MKSNFVSFLLLSLSPLSDVLDGNFQTDHIWNNPFPAFLAVSYKQWYQQYIIYKNAKMKKKVIFINIC